MSPLILHTDNLASHSPAVVFGSGLPNQIEGRPVSYRRKEVAKAGKYVHRGSGEPFEITNERMDKWAELFKKRLAKGIKPFITPFHVDHAKDPDARDTLGYVIGLEREGDGLYATEQLIGDEALSASAANDVSVYIVADAVDDESLHHLALTPSPALTNLGGHVKIAASAGGGAAQIPVYELSATARSTPMKGETITKLRAKLKLGPEIKDEDVAEQAAALALADPPADKTAEVTALSASVTSLKAELDEAKAKVLSLSASEEPSGLSLSLIARSFKTDRDQVIASGVISEAGMKEVDMLLMPTGKPSGVALALSAGGTDPLYSRLCEILRRNPGVKTGNAVIRASAADPPTHTTYTGEQQDDPAKEREEARAEAKRWQDAQLTARGMK